MNIIKTICRGTSQPVPSQQGPQTLQQKLDTLLRNSSSFTKTRMIQELSKIDRNDEFKCFLQNLGLSTDIAAKTKLTRIAQNILKKNEWGIFYDSQRKDTAFIYQLLRLCDADLAQFINPNGTIKKEWPKSFINKQNQRITFEYHRLMTSPNTYRLNLVKDYIKEKLKDPNNHEHNLLFPIQLSTLISGYEASIDEIVPDNTPVEDIQHISNPYIHHPTLGWKIRFQDLYDPRLEFSHLNRSGESISLQTPVIRQIKSAAKADS